MSSSMDGLLRQQIGKTNMIIRRKKTPEAVRAQPRFPNRSDTSSMNGARQPLTGGPCSPSKDKYYGDGVHIPEH